MKNLLILILSAICLFLFFNRKKVYEEVETIPIEVKETVDVEVERINKKIDFEGIEHAVISELENTVRKYKDLRDSAKIEIDSISNLLEISQNQLKSYISYNSILKDSLLAAKQISDSLYRYEDSTIKLEFINPRIRDPYFNVQVNTRVNHAIYHRRKGIFGPKKSYVDLWTSDPRTSINGVKKYRIQDVEKTSGLKIKASSFYLDDLRLGLDSDLKLGRFNINTGYFYNLNKEKWGPMMKLDYTITEF